MIPVLIVLLKTERTPQSMAAENAAPGMDNRHWTRPEVLRTPLFWAVIPGLTAFPALATAFWFHQVHYAQVNGWSHLSIVAVFPLGTAAFILSTLGFGWALDRVGSGRLMPFYLLPLACGFAVLAFAPSVPFVALGIVLMGVAGGGQATLPSACWAEFFGTRSLGAIKSMVTSVLVLGSALGPGISGALIGRGIAMPDQLGVFAALFVIFSALMVLPIARARLRLPGATKIDVIRA